MDKSKSTIAAALALLIAQKGKKSWLLMPTRMPIWPRLWG
jgi:reverse gyrase